MPLRSATSSSAIPTGPRAVKIIFKQSYPNGSFDAPSAAGTLPKPGFGHPATRVFNAFWDHNASDEIKTLRHYWAQATGSKKVA